MGEDAVTGKSYEHRRAWLYQFIRQLARVFAIDILGTGLMGNHFHQILRNRPDLVGRMSDREVALRWCLCSDQGRQVSDQSSKQQRQAARKKVERRVQAICRDPERLAELRARLSSISWLQGRIKETIAWQANREDGVTGRFWEGRFEAVAITNSEVLLAAMQYVDLNPIRAGLADRPETSQYTSAYDRILALQARRRLLQNSDGQPDPQQLRRLQQLSEQATLQTTFDEWLSPIDERRDAEISRWLEPDVPGTRDQGEPPPPFTGDSALVAVGSVNTGPVRWEIAPESYEQLPPRASNRGCLPMTPEQYLEVLDWTGRQLRADKRGAIPTTLPPILERIGCADVDAWFETLTGYANRIRRFVTRPVNQAQEMANCLINAVGGRGPLPAAHL